MHDPDLDRLVDRMLEGDEQSRRDFLRRLAGTGLTFSGAATLLAACGGVKGENKSSGSATTPTSAHHPKVPIGDWTFSNWPLYIDKKVIKQFNAKHGGNCKYVEDINDNFEFFAKVRQQLQAGESIKRDIVVLTDYMAARWVRNGYVDPLDKANIPNFKNLVANLRSPKYDPKRSYTLPWQSGGTIIGYNRAKTGKKITSLKELFDPRYKGRVSFLSEAYDSAGLVMLKNGVDPTNAKLPDILKAIDEMDKANKAGQIRRFTGNDYTTDLTKGNVWLAMAYSGDLVQLKADNPSIEYAFPTEGGMLFTDNMMIPHKAAHPYAAETMMNYVYDPKVAAVIAAYVNYITPVEGVKEVLQKTDPKTASNPLIFPSAALKAKLHAYPTLTPAEEQQMRARMSQVTGA
jgi:spermidine/putrescine transport system substrate-binding protein